MRNILSILVLSTLLASAICTDFLGSQDDKPLHPPQDDSTFANINQVQATHYNFDIKVDFTKKILDNTVIISFKSLIDDLDKVILDQAFVTIKSITDSDKAALTYKVETVDPKVVAPSLGAPLTITLNKKYKKDETFNIKIAYETTDKVTAISWMTKAQTSSGLHPFLYSENQPSWARSWIIGQDTPSIKTTYEATITAPAELLARMSAKLVSETVSEDKKTKVTKLKMDMPIATYLMAIVVGELEYRKIGDRTGCYAEPSQIERVANELSELE